MAFYRTLTRNNAKNTIKLQESPKSMSFEDFPLFSTGFLVPHKKDTSSIYYHIIQIHVVKNGRHALSCTKLRECTTGFSFLGSGGYELCPQNISRMGR